MQLGLVAVKVNSKYLRRIDVMSISEHMGLQVQAASKTTDSNRDGLVTTIVGHRCLWVLLTAVTIKEDQGVDYVIQLNPDDLGSVLELRTPDNSPSQHIGDHGRNITLGLEVRDSGFQTLTCLGMEFRISGPTSTGMTSTQSPVQEAGQCDEDYGAYVDRGAKELFVSRQDSMPQADHRRGWSPEDYDSRWSYGQSSPAHPRMGNRAYRSVPDPAFISQADATGQDCGHRNRGVSDKAHRTASPEQRRPYLRPNPNPRLNRNYATETAPYGWQRVAVASDENIPPQTQPIHQPHSRSERVKRNHPKIPLGPSNTAAAPPPPGNASSPPDSIGFESFYPAYPSEQRRRQTESSTDSDAVDGCFATHNSRHKGESTYHSLPHRTRSINRQAHQELRRCALAAAALQLERSKLRREWKKLRREQETLLHGQRRLRHDWQNLKEKQRQHPHLNNDSESTDPCNETESSSENDYVEEPPHKSQHRRTEDLGAGRYRSSRVFEQTNHDPRGLLDKYNRQWNTLLSGSSTDIPWPTADLKAATLYKPHFRTPQVLLNSANPQDLLKWNAFNFFASAFGSRATLKQTANGIVMNISATSVEVVKAIRNQAREDIKRWHQDKLACRDGELASDEKAKAVFAAVFELYGICTERIRTS